MEQLSGWARKTLPFETPPETAETAPVFGSFGGVRMAPLDLLIARIDNETIVVRIVLTSSAMVMRHHIDGLVLRGMSVAVVTRPLGITQKHVVISPRSSARK